VLDSVEPPRAPDLTPQRERLGELGLHLRPRLRAPALVQYRDDDLILLQLPPCEAVESEETEHYESHARNHVEHFKWSAQSFV